MSRKKDEPVLDVGVVYLMGTIGESGDFDAGSVSPAIRLVDRSCVSFPDIRRSYEVCDRLAKTMRLDVLSCESILAVEESLIQIQ